MSNSTHGILLNREQWLTLCVDMLRPHFRDAGAAEIPASVRVSCGFPSRSATSAKRRRIGECWTPAASADQMAEIFVSPTLSDGYEVAAVLAHECVHATVGLAAKHSGPFRTLALAIGLEGKMTATRPGARFAEWYAQAALPAYPHGALTPMIRDKQATRLLKVSCPKCEAEGVPYLVRMSARTLAIGAPLCPIHLRPMSAV